MDIKTVNPKDIPKHDMLVAGFPCQDFSVGALNKLSKGLERGKGTLWYQIRRILESTKSIPTEYPNFTEAEINLRTKIIIEKIIGKWELFDVE